MGAEENIVGGKRIDFFLLAVQCGLVLLLIFFIIISASVPPVSKDALTHHLAVPKLYLKHGGIYEIPSMVSSYNPMNLDLLYLIPLYFGNDIIPKFIHFSFALFTAWLIFDYLKRRISTIYALLGATFFLSIPIIVKLSITVYVDLGLIFFSTASLFLLIKWVETGFRLRFLTISAISCGLAMGTKYNGLITFFLLTLFVPLIYSRYRQADKGNFIKSIGQGLFFLIIALLIFSPWMIRSYIWTNNPVYPLYDQFFNPQNMVLQSSISPFVFRSLVHHESWWQIVLIPVRIFFEGQDGNPQYFDGKLNPFLLFLPFLAFYKIRGEPNNINTEKRILLGFAVLYFAFSFFSTSMRIRYISPIIPPLVILSIFGIRKMVEASSALDSNRLRRTCITLVFVSLCVAFVLNAIYIFKQYKHVNPLSYLNGTLNRDEYIEKYRLEYPVIRYINENLPGDAKILFIYMGNRGYYCDRDYIFDMDNNRSTLLQLVKRSSSPETILSGLRDMGITHLLIRYDIFDKWVNSSFTHKERVIMEIFFEKYVKPLFFKWGYGVSLLKTSFF